MANSNLPALCSLEDFLKNDYDFIVVGGGTAGLTVAARLTENANIKVGVLEAGASNIGDPMIMTPALYPKIIGDPKYDWKHLTDKTPFQQPRGKGLGGSSAINYQMYVRGHASDYDDWANLGNKGWSFKDLLPYFRKHEHFDDPTNYKNKSNIPLETKYDAGFHGRDGPIHTSFSTWRLPQEREWIAAASTLGDKMGSPMNAWSGDHLGMYHSLSTIDRSGGEADGTRSYAVTGYLLPNAQRPNLKVLTEALVEKLVVSPDGTVSGVEFEHDGKSHKVSVKKEVVLSAGVFKTPQILELSGIGNLSILTAAGIKPLVNNPRVGENFHDHPATGFGYELVDGEQSLDAMQDPSYVETVMAEYAATRNGPLSTGGAAMGFVSYADLATPSEISALQDLMLSPSHGGHTAEAKQLLAKGIASKDEASIQIVLLPASLTLREARNQTKFFAQPPEMAGKHGFLLGACLSRPLSVGTVHISSSDPKVDPEIDPAYMSHPADIEIFSKGLAIVEKMVNTSPFKEKVKRRYHPDGPLDLSDKKAVETYLRGNVATEYHPLGSCAMGKEGAGAVDDRLKVYGCKGVRVVDASVIPLHVSGNIVATVYALAEKGADLIKEDWKL
ncbi:GMC oxidoreductase [Cadophora sp. DSE1049]|nr:GMC oxidoreductase [Cadophora sp. DSE1049]